MALWGKQDAAAPSQGTTVGVTNASTAVTGSGTAFLTDLDIGDVLIITSGTTTKNRVAAIASDTALTLADTFTGTTAASLAIANVKIQQQPKNVYQDSNTPKGQAALETVFGVDVTEMKAGGDNTVSAAISSAGSRYIATDNSSTAPTVSFSGGGGSSAAASVTIASNAVSTIVLSNVGSSYTSAPTITITKPRRTIPTASITASTDTIAYTGHLLVAGDAVTYNNGGGASATGLTSTTTYYVATAGLTANAFEVKAANTTGTLAATVATSGTGGQFTCGNSTLAVGDRVTITGTLGGTGTITSYATGTTYKVSTVTGTSPSVTGFTLTTEAGGALTTTAGTLTGLTYTTETVIDISATGNAAQYFEIAAAAEQATATATLGSGTQSTITAPGWVRRTVLTGGKAGRVQYETLVAGRSLITGDASDDIALPDA
jgi:hypothetical protein